ncbi:MAG: DedA family protein [Endomicrobium sp.]|jgi:membrane protein YqaA with SNARE-associated domain|nr:DedA family protein [Endomicrobium sp.]
MKKIIDMPFKLIRRLYDWTLHWSKTKKSNYALFGIAFLESFIFPIPTDILLIPMIVFEPKNWYKKALTCTIGSVCGALVGYYVGRIFYDTVGLAIINFYDLHHVMSVIGEKYSKYAFLSIFVGAFTPIPYKVLTVSSGIFRVSLPVLIIASILGRGGRFFIVAAAIRIFGKKIQNIIEKNFNILFLIFFTMLIGGFLTFKYLI